MKVVSEIANKLALNNVNLIHERIENIFIDIPAICTFKAVGKVHDFLCKINTDQKLQVFFYKGPNFYTLEQEQINLSKKDWKELSLSKLKSILKLFLMSLIENLLNKLLKLWFLLDYANIICNSQRTVHGSRKLLASFLCILMIF